MESRRCFDNGMLYVIRNNETKVGRVVACGPPSICETLAHFRSDDLLL